MVDTLIAPDVGTEPQVASIAAPQIFAALVAAQKAMGPLYKNATNPAFRSKYANLASIMETITEPLNDNGLAIIQTVERRDDQLTLVTRLVHVSGETLEGTYPIYSQSTTDPQKLASAMTYARRYSLMGLLGLAAEDDDGNAASGRSAEPRNPNAPSAAQVKLAKSLLKEVKGAASATEADAITKELAGKSFKELTGKEMNEKIIKPLNAEKGGFK